MALSLRDLEIGVNLYLTALPNTSDGAVPMPFDIQGRKFAKYVANVGTGLICGMQNISMAVATTGGDLDLSAFSDIVSNSNIAFANIVSFIVQNTTEDPTAHIYLDKGATNGLDLAAPAWTTWRCGAYGMNSKGENVPGVLFNHNTNSSFQWPVASVGARTVNLNSNTPATATTLTGRLIVIGRP